MNIIEQFLDELDRLWSGSSEGKIELRILGSTALFLQTDYQRGTKDSDVFETDQLSGDVSGQLVALAGKDSILYNKYRIYIDIVDRNIPMLPPEPLWNHLPVGLQHFSVSVLDPVDVVLSKLKRWSSNDRDDARAMIEAGHVDHDFLVTRFLEVIERYRFDGRADLLERMAQRLNDAEVDWFGTEETAFDFPEETFR